MIEEDIQQAQQLMDRVVTYLKDHSPQIVSAVIILLLGMLVGRFLSRFVLNLCGKKHVDVTLARFFASSVQFIIVSLFVIMAVTKIGVEITPFIALLGAGAFGLSLAVQGPISNFAAGIVLIITRPFKVADTLTVHGRTGLVESVNLGNTQLMTEDGEEITIPNRQLLGEILTNSFENLVVEGVVGIDYAADPEVAIEAVKKAIKDTNQVVVDREPQVGIQGFGDSSIDIGYRYWVPTKCYYNIQYSVNLAVFKALKASAITIPFPQRDVHMIDPSK
tara:strand:- start:546 stop:1376 length:831 start_codon:yes stop_codon:yes gene_type:complete